MYWWEVTKYDPALRDEWGAYTRDEWTDASCVGHEIAGHVLGADEYLQTENAYVKAVRAFLEDAGQPALLVCQGLERYDEQLSYLAPFGLDDVAHERPRLEEGEWLTGDDLERVCRLILRNAVWCKLEAPDLFAVHFGQDYYMYIGSHSPSVRAIERTEASGLFVEQIESSPYNESDADL